MHLNRTFKGMMVNLMPVITRSRKSTPQAATPSTSVKRNPIRSTQSPQPNKGPPGDYSNSNDKFKYEEDSSPDGHESIDLDNTSGGSEDESSETGSYDSSFIDDGEHDSESYASS